MYTEVLLNSFPISQRIDAEAIEATIDLKLKHKQYMPFKVFCNKESLVIPMRVYIDESQLDLITKLAPIQKEMVYCFYSRHCDGFVRERCLKKIIESDNLFASPFILQLLGEYVIEIIEVLYQNREQINIENLITFIRENPAQYEITRQRVYSYWDCFYRGDYPKYKSHVKPKGKTYLDYPGIKMVKYINEKLSSKRL